MNRLQAITATIVGPVRHRHAVEPARPFRVFVFGGLLLACFLATSLSSASGDLFANATAPWLLFLAAVILVIDCIDIPLSDGGRLQLTAPFIATMFAFTGVGTSIVAMAAVHAISLFIVAKSWRSALERMTLLSCIFQSVLAGMTALHALAPGLDVTVIAIAGIVFSHLGDYCFYPQFRALEHRDIPWHKAVSPRLNVSWARSMSASELRMELTQFALEVPTVVMLVMLFGLHAWAPVLMGSLFLLISQMFRQNSRLNSDIVVANRRLTRANLQFATAMVRALDARDSYTAGHSAAVAIYTQDIARQMGMSDDFCRLAHLAGLLHDIGKIGVPGHVLNKQGRLSSEEYELMKEHAAIGAAILGEVDEYANLALIVRHHHERFDGKGYPEGLSGEAIPALSRMLIVADTYSAMTTDRPYREGLAPEIAFAEIAAHSGTQFDPQFVEAFLTVIKSESDAYQRGRLAAFQVEIAKHQTLANEDDGWMLAA